MTSETLKSWLKRFFGVTLNSTLLALIMFADALNALDVARIDWADIFGDERGKTVAQAILIGNILLRAFVTKTRGSPDA